jgi:putative membrane protein
MNRNEALVFLLAAVVSGIAVYAEGKLAPADSTFVRKAAEGGLAEVKLGQLAKEKASSKAVKDFGDRMVKDHSKAGEELKEVASKKGITLRDSMNAKDKALYDRLSKLSGSEFDKAYMEAMIKDHEEDVAEFRRESQSAKDPDIREFTSKTLPTLEEHLRLAKDTGSKVGVMSPQTKGATAQK